MAVLNWGLGHATRCIPIVKCLLQEDVNVLLASDGAALELLKKEFPELSSFSLPSYNVRYPFDSMVVNVLLQLPKIVLAIQQERKAIQRLVTEQDVQILISDNRFGCYTPKTYNVFMTHQLNIMAPFSLAEKVIAFWNKKILSRFDLCWVPDFEKAPGLSGDLSHPSPVASVKYIGPLSRMEAIKVKKKYDAIVILSGPEPQRTRLEKLILQQAKNLPYRFLVVRGKMMDRQPLFQKENIDIVGHLLANDLAKAIASAEVVIARSGYTTIMDLYALQKKAILVPTPGQTEQEYLGRLLSERGWFVVEEQE
ncbi:MAG: glycosyltransferase [Saprospiraceae bacterium]